jgi:serine/threonine-protein kinase
MMVTSSVKLVRPLGEGGMGSVWLAEHQSLHTQVVVKFIAAEFTTSPEALARFSREAAAASQVKSPHVVQTLDHGITSEGLPYIVMEYLEGRDLENHLLQVGRMPPHEVAEVVTQLSRALEKAHAVGIVHRDIKPANIFFCDAGDGALFVKLLDFGIAKGMNIPLLDSGTRTGTMIGSPFYMSPEQLVGAKDMDHRTDLWSVGVVAFEAVTGRRAFDAETVGGLALKIHNEPTPLPSQVSPELANLDEWFMHACAKKPEERFGSAKEMADSLMAAVTGRRTHTSMPPTSGMNAPGSAGGSGSSPGSRRSPDPLVGSAKTQLAPGTDPRGRTDGGLGLQAPQLQSPPRKGRTVGLLVGGVVFLGLAAFGVVKLGKGQAGTAGPDMGSNQVQSAAIATGAPTGSGAGGNGGSNSANGAATGAPSTAPSAQNVQNASGAPSSVPSAVAVGSGSGSAKPIRPLPSHKPSQNTVPLASSGTAAPKRTDDIY